MKAYKSFALCLVLLLLLNPIGGIAIAAEPSQDNTAKNTNPFGGSAIDTETSKDNTEKNNNPFAPSGGNRRNEEPALALGFIYIGTDSASSGTHSFVEIYNPNDFTVTLTDTYSLQYKSMAPSGAEYVTPDWIKLNLEGEIPAYHSFLVNLGETGALPSGSASLDLTGVTFDQDFVWPAGIKGYNKGVKFVLMSNQDLLPSSLLNPFTGDGAGQVDGYVDMYGVSGNDNTAPSVDGYETERILANEADAQSKQKGFVRINTMSGIKYEDTDNNLDDFQQVDFRSSDKTNASLIPRSLADGAWTQTITDTFAAETLTLQPGSSERDLNFNWYSSRTDNTASIVQIAKKSDMDGGLFPTVDVITVTGTVGDASDEKSWHKAGVTGLDFDTEYVYRVSNDGTKFSRIYEYKTGTSGAFQFIVVGDSQLTLGNQDSDSIWPNPVTTTRAGWKNTLDKISQHAPDARFIASAGDQVDTQPSNANNKITTEIEYSYYLEPEQLRSLPIAPSPGNHELTGSAWPNKNVENFNWHYNVPNHYTDDADFLGNYWYVYNNALYVVLNTAPYPSTTAQVADLIEVYDAVLEEATDANPDAQWLFVTHHKSTTSPASHQNDADVMLYAPAFGKLMDKYEVDFVLAGHDHVYSRSWFIQDNQKVEDVDYETDTVIDPEGTLYFTFTTSSGLKYYDFPTSQPNNGPEWVSDTSGMYTERKSGSNDINGKPWYTNIGIQIKAPQFTTVDVTESSATFTTYRTDTMAVIDEYTVVKTSAAEPPESGSNRGGGSGSGSATILPLTGTPSGSNNENTNPASNTESSNPNPNTNNPNPSPSSSSSSNDGNGQRASPLTNTVVYLAIFLCLALIGVGGLAFYLLKMPK